VGEEAKPVVNVTKRCEFVAQVMCADAGFHADQARRAMGFMAAKFLFAASEIGLFEALADGPASTDEIATRIAVPQRTTGIVLAADNFYSFPAKGNLTVNRRQMGGSIRLAGASSTTHHSQGQSASLSWRRCSTSWTQPFQLHQRRLLALTTFPAIASFALSGTVTARLQLPWREDLQSSLSSSIFTVTQFLPPGGFQYKIENAAEPHERVARERQLGRAA
jgi:Dimerisation domain